MSTTIEQVTISSVTEKRLVLANSQWGATLDIGDDWTTLRIGLRYTFTDVGVGLTGPVFCAGALADPNVELTNGPLTNGTSHFVGTKWAASVSWSRTVNFVPFRYRAISLTTPFCKRVGATDTTAGATIASAIFADTTFRMPFYLEITKGSPNFTVSMMYNAGASPSLDVVYSTLVFAMNLPTLTDVVAVYGGTYAVASTTVAVDEATNGFLNAVCVAWNRTTPTVHISEILFAKMA